MRRPLVAVLVLAVNAMSAVPALAWDPFGDDLSIDDPAPVDPAPFVVPDGIYVVTDVYAGDVVVSSGSTTTYTTTTEHETPGTYARIVDVVGTGQASSYDGTSLNGRARLPDGRVVAGAYYEDFVLTASGYVSVNVVFFQDDSVTTLTAASPTPAPVATAVPAHTAVPPAAPTATPAPLVTQAPLMPTPAPIVATAGVALGATAPVLASIDVLRGRRVALWPRAFVNGSPVPVRSWRLVSGGADLVSARSGDGSTSCDVALLTLAPNGSAWTLRFEVTSDALPGRVLAATIDVTVRSPALLQ